MACAIHTGMMHKTKTEKQYIYNTYMPYKAQSGMLRMVYRIAGGYVARYAGSDRGVRQGSDLQWYWIS